MALIEDAGHTETDPDTPTPLITLASCPVDSRPDGAPRLWGKLRIRIKRGTLAHEAYGVTRAEESFTCNYELNPNYQSVLEKSGMIISGVSRDGGARIVELPTPRWFVGTGFLPQLGSAPRRPHPLIVAYLKAALALKKLRTKGPERPETIENRWDFLYRDYPEVYDEFASVPTRGKQWIDAVREIVSLKGKIVADIGSGSGKSTFELARRAELVIGIEPEDAMADIAIKNTQELNLLNVAFKKGRATAIPLENGSVDVTASSTGAFYNDPDSIRRFVAEAERITRPGGHIVLIEIAPKWYGGELAAVILGKERGDDMEDRVLTKLGFAHRDHYETSDYGTVEKAVATYGFIFGSKAIAYLRKHHKTTIKRKIRTYYKQV